MIGILLVTTFIGASAQGPFIPTVSPPIPSVGTVPIERCTDCHCYEEVCTNIGYGFCKSGACGSNCQEDKCCCCDEELKSVSCSGGACRCNNETCPNLNYCDPDRCPDDCQANHCCCEDLCPSWADCQCLQNPCKLEEGMMECDDCEHCKPGHCCCCEEEWPTCSETARCKCEKVKCDEIPGYGYCDADRCLILENDFQRGVLTSEFQQLRCPHDQCCCKMDQVTIPHACPNKTMCRCTRTDCFKLGLEYCECSDCPDNYCCCFKTLIGRCSSSESCSCQPEGESCLELGMRYCPPDRCEGCEGYRCCCPDKCPNEQCFWSSTDCGSTLSLQYCDKRRCPPISSSTHRFCCCKNFEIGFIDRPCLDGSAFCVCAPEQHTCWSLGVGYCDCSEITSPDDCPPNMCCCKSQAHTCPEGSPCRCLLQRSCPELGLAYCDPSICGPLCPPYRCCCRLEAIPIFSRAGFITSCGESICDECFAKNLPYLPLYFNKDCPDGQEQCCADTITESDQNMQKCSPESESFMLTGNKICAELGYGYAKPEECPDTKGSQCCCEIQN